MEVTDRRSPTSGERGEEDAVGVLQMNKLRNILNALAPFKQAMVCHATLDQHWLALVAFLWCSSTSYSVMTASCRLF